MIKLLKNNHGSTLLMVIVCMLFVGIIGTTMLTVTLTNRKMKNVENKAKENFYTTETALDEFVSGLEEMAGDALADAYQNLLVEYTFVSDTNRANKFKSDFVTKLTEKLMEMFGSDATFEANKNSFFTLQDVNTITWLKRPEIITDLENGNIRLKDVSIALRDEQDFETFITTDIVLAAKYPEFGDGASQHGSDAFIDYGIITDSTLRNTLNGHAQVKSNIYAGGYDKTAGQYTGSGVYTSDGVLDIFTEKLITRTSIDVSGNGRINIDHLQGNENPAQVWTRNIFVKDNSNVTYEPNLDINGVCYVADDLNLGSKGSNVVISGEYYGYSTNNISSSNRTGNASNSSAITINADAITLDLTGLDKLYLAGKSYISASSVYGDGIQGTVAAELIEGEGLTYRNLQSAYLLPGDCVVGIGHNPMTVEEYSKLVDPSLDDICYIDLLQSQKNGGVRLGDYVKISDPYRQVFVRYLDSTMVYLYLNFQNPDKGSEYFAKYNEIFDDVVALNMNSLFDADTNRGSILLNPASLTSTGNIIAYSESDGYQLIEKSHEYFDVEIENKAYELSGKYNGLTNALDESFTSLKSMPYLTDRIVDFKKIPGYPDYVTTNVMDLNEEEINSYKLITGENITIDTMMKGIVIASGSVTVKSAFTGIIIAKDDIILEANASISSDPVGIRDLFANETHIPQVEIAKKYFRIFSGDTGTNENDTSGAGSIQITYENWRKN